MQALHSFDADARSKFSAYDIDMDRCFSMADNVANATTNIFTTIKSNPVAAEG